MPSELVEELYSTNLYFENNIDEYIESDEEFDYTSNDYLDLVSSNYQIPLVDQNRVNVLNYIDRLGFVLTSGGLYKKEDYNSKYNVDDFMKEQVVPNEDIDNTKTSIEKIKNFFRQKKIQKSKNKNITLKTQIKEDKELKENKNAWFKEEVVVKNDTNTTFDKNFPILLKTNVKVDSNEDKKTVVNNQKNDKVDDKLLEKKSNDNSDESDDEYDLSYLVQKNSKNITNIINKNPIDKHINQTKNFNSAKNDKDKGWIKVETSKEIKHIKERNNAYDILSDKDKLKTKLKRTKLCLSVLNKTHCPHKENCRYAHKFEDLEPCLFSDNCRFIKKDKGSYVNISKTKICEYKHKNETESNYFNRINVNNNIKIMNSSNKNDKNLNIKKL
jgi:hypothetical protein